MLVFAVVLMFLDFWRGFPDCFEAIYSLLDLMCFVERRRICLETLRVLDLLERFSVLGHGWEL